MALFFLNLSPLLLLLGSFLIFIKLVIYLIYLSYLVFRLELHQLALKLSLKQPCSYRWQANFSQVSMKLENWDLSFGVYLLKDL